MYGTQILILFFTYLQTNPNGVSEQSYAFYIPHTPTVSSTLSCVPMGEIGFAINGVALFNPLSGPDTNAVQVSKTSYFCNITTPCTTISCFLINNIGPLFSSMYLTSVNKVILQGIWYGHNFHHNFNDIYSRFSKMTEPQYNSSHNTKV